MISMNERSVHQAARSVVPIAYKCLIQLCRLLPIYLIHRFKALTQRALHVG